MELPNSESESEDSSSLARRDKGGILLTGAGLATGAGLLLTSEGPRDTRSDIDIPKDGLRSSLRFSDGGGRISAIEFHQDGNVRRGIEMISFEGSDYAGRRRSNFNEDLLNSSGPS